MTYTYPGEPDYKRLLFAFGFTTLRPRFFYRPAGKAGWLPVL